uniref:Cell division protein FTSH n=1 Tax=Codium arabicum TaxID=221038 RepID=A0A386B0G0_CODAR|nr:Cell division protein FTSH [Codium arabicum]AYC65184.1 Cell division protein FTSH [Codium arabicum]
MSQFPLKKIYTIVRKNHKFLKKCLNLKIFKNLKNFENLYLLFSIYIGFFAVFQRVHTNLNFSKPKIYNYSITQYVLDQKDSKNEVSMVYILYKIDPQIPHKIQTNVFPVNYDIYQSNYILLQTYANEASIFKNRISFVKYDYKTQFVSLIEFNQKYNSLSLPQILPNEITEIQSNLNHLKLKNLSFESQNNSQLYLLRSNLGFKFLNSTTKNQYIHPIINKYFSIKIKYSSIPSDCLIAKSPFVYKPSSKMQEKLFHYFNNNSLVNFSKKSGQHFVSYKYENVSKYSYLIVLYSSFIFCFFYIFNFLYKDYGKDIVLFVIEILQVIGLIQDEDLIKEDLNLVPDYKYYKVIRNTSVTLKKIAGIESIMLDISEIIWFLRSKKIQKQFLNTVFSVLFFQYQTKKVTNYFLFKSKSFLFVGPPGTGKTFVVQAIANEAQVPLLIQSGSMLKDPQRRGRGMRILQNLFKYARRVSPSIVFIDEIDGLGMRRENLAINSIGSYDLMEFLETELYNIFIAQKVKKKSIEDYLDTDEFTVFEDLPEDYTQINTLNLTDNLIKMLQQNENDNKSRLENLSLLTQLLVELDGLFTLTNIVVVGATNRIQILDPALLRPGRFNTIIPIDLPNSQKRIDILKLATNILGTDFEINWDYFSKRTQGLSSSTLATIVNESALIAINRNHTHTDETIEQGIWRVTAFPIQKNILVVTRESKQFLQFYSQFYLQYDLAMEQVFLSNLPSFDQKQLQINLRTAFYAISRILFSLFFAFTPAECFATYFEYQYNFRHNQQNRVIDLLNNTFFFRINLEAKLTFLVSGKAAELLSNNIPIQKYYDQIFANQKRVFQYLELTTLGYFDLRQASNLAKYMISKWYFYAEQIITEKYHWIGINCNQLEFEIEELKFVTAVSNDINFQFDQQNIFFKLFQKWSYHTWWQKEVRTELTVINRSILDWYRIYLSDPENTEQNIEWVPPDLYFSDKTFEQLNSLKSWNHFLLWTQDYLYQGLLLNAYNLSFKILYNWTELLDFLADQIFCFGSLKEQEVKNIIYTFFKVYKHKKFVQQNKFLIKQMLDKQLKDDEPLILRHSWGEFSRFKKSRKLFLQQMYESKIQVQINMVLETAEIEVQNLLSDSQQKSHLIQKAAKQKGDFLIQEIQHQLDQLTLNDVQEDPKDQSSKQTVPDSIYEDLCNELYNELQYEEIQEELQNVLKQVKEYVQEYVKLNVHKYVQEEEEEQTEEEQDIQDEQILLLKNLLTQAKQKAQHLQSEAETISELLFNKVQIKIDKIIKAARIQIKEIRRKGEEDKKRREQKKQTDIEEF